MKKKYIAPEFELLNLAPAALDVVINPGTNPSDGYAEDPGYPDD